MRDRKQFSELSKGISKEKLDEARLGLLYQTKEGPPAAQSYRQYTPEIWPPPRNFPRQRPHAIVKLPEVDDLI